MPEQSRLDILSRQRPAKKRIVHQVDLAHREVVRCSPPCVEQAELLGVQRPLGVDQVIAGRSDRLATGARIVVGRRIDGGRSRDSYELPWCDGRRCEAYALTKRARTVRCGYSS